MNILLEDDEDDDSEEPEPDKSRKKSKKNLLPKIEEHMKKKQKPHQLLTEEQARELQTQVEADQASQPKDNPLYTGKPFDETMRGLAPK